MRIARGNVRGKWLGKLGKVTHKGPPHNPFGQRAKVESEVLDPGLACLGKLPWPLDSALFRPPTLRVPCASRLGPALQTPVGDTVPCPGEAALPGSARDPPRSHSLCQTKGGAATSSLLLGLTASCSNFISSFPLFQVTGCFFF